MSEVIKQIKDRGFPYYPEDGKWPNHKIYNLCIFDSN